MTKNVGCEKTRSDGETTKAAILTGIVSVNNYNSSPYFALSNRRVKQKTHWCPPSIRCSNVT